VDSRNIFRIFRRFPDLFESYFVERRIIKITEWRLKKSVLAHENDLIVVSDRDITKLFDAFRIAAFSMQQCSENAGIQRQKV